jgi:transposase
MQVWTEIRRRVLVEKVPKRQICREYQISHHTLAKMLQNVEPTGYQQRPGERPRPKLGAFLGVIDQILEDDKTAPKKQRHTAKRIFERLRDEHDYTGSESQVRAVVAQHRERHAEVFVPLAQPPGEAQFDFGEAVVVIADIRMKAALAVMSLPYSDAFHVTAYPRECTETFQAAHDNSFEFFEGVPTKIAYDNTSVAVKKVLEGPNRELTTEFLRLESHFLFTHRFCRVARGNEKGHVESLVGYHRRNFLVPVPRFASFAELNVYLTRRCEEELDRTVRGKSQTKRQRLETDRAAMLGFPATSFESRKVTHAKSNSLSLVRFDRNDYSVPTAYAHQDVVVIGGVESIKIVAQGHLVATHTRSWDKAQTFYEPVHYLALLERKPGAFDAARPLEDWQLPACFWSLRRRLEVDMGPTGVKEYIKVLRLLERHSMRDLRIAVERAAVMLSVNADVVELLIRAKNETPVELFSLDGHAHLRSVSLESPDLTAYATLTAVNS